MAEEIIDKNDNEEQEQEQEKNSKAGLVVAFIMLALIIALLAMGITFYFVIRDVQTGQINVEGENVSIEATASITGVPNPPTLDKIVINADGSSGQDSWQNLNLVFTEETSIITITINVYNVNEINSLALVFDNLTTAENINIEQYYYLNGQADVPMEISNQDPVYLTGGDYATFVVNFSIKDRLESVTDVLNINIHCTNIEL